MHRYTQEELAEALKVVDSSIRNCEKMQPKFAEGTSQHTLLKNRINALYISQALITAEEITDKYTKEELIKALPPVASIISKCEKAQQKHEEDSPYYRRLKKMIDAMSIAKALIDEEISKRG